jgi:hypothetical protein
METKSLKLVRPATGLLVGTWMSIKVNVENKDIFDLLYHYTQTQHIRKSSTALLLLMAAWADGCGGAPTPVATQGQLTKTIELKEATRTPLSTPGPAEITVPPEAKGVVQIAPEDLAHRLRANFQTGS